MSIDVMASVWKHSKHHGTALLMLLAIADSANEYGEAWPSVDHLAEKCRMKKRNAQLLLKQLEESGDLQIGRQEGRQTAHGKTNMYVLITPGALTRDGVQSSTPDVAQYTPGVQNSVGRGAKFGSDGVQSSTPRSVIDPLVNQERAVGTSKSEPPPRPTEHPNPSIVGALIERKVYRGQAIGICKVNPSLAITHLEAWDRYLERNPKKGLGFMISALQSGELYPPGTTPTHLVNGVDPDDPANFTTNGEYDHAKWEALHPVHPSMYRRS